jgi:hypothetical protein
MHANPNNVMCASPYAARKHPPVTTPSVIKILALHRSNPNATSVKYVTTGANALSICIKLNDKYEYATFAADRLNAVHAPMGKMFATHSPSVNSWLSFVHPTRAASADAPHPNHDPNELTNIGQLSDVSVMRCLFASINTVAKTKYAALCAAAYSDAFGPYVLSSIPPWVLCDKKSNESNARAPVSSSSSDC